MSQGTTTTTKEPKNNRQWESDWKQLQESQHVQDAGLYSFIWNSSEKARMEIRVSGEDTITHEIPFLVDDDGTSLHSPIFGKLILLPENSEVRVTSSTENNHNRKQWKLQWTRFADALPAKCIACATCRRTFATLRAVQTHARRLHPDEHTDKNSIFQQSLCIIYNDDALAVIDKPQGMTVQGDKETLWKSDLLLPLASQVAGPGVFRKPRPVHRLDCATGGLLVVAKTRTADAKLREAFATRTCKKRYRALVWGEMQSNGICEEPIKGRHAKTEYKPLQVIRFCQTKKEEEASSLPDTCMTVVDLWPETGRTHQIRKHLKGLKHSIIGDIRYGGGKAQPGPYGSKLCLWAMEISFSHPVSGETVHCQLENPDWLQYLVKYAQDHRTESQPMEKRIELELTA